MKRTNSPRRALFGALLLSLLATQGFGHGDEKHPEKGVKSDHMQAMMALKEQIPPEYRIMERTPVIPDEHSLARGRELYLQQCAACHGEQGRGDGPAAKALATPPADFLDREHSAIYGPGEKYWIIGHGTGKTGMPGFAQIAPEDRWHLVNFILDLQKDTEGTRKEKGSHQHGH